MDDVVVVERAAEEDAWAIWGGWTRVEARRKAKVARAMVSVLRSFWRGLDNRRRMDAIRLLLLEVSLLVMPVPVAGLLSAIRIVGFDEAALVRRAPLKRICCVDLGVPDPCRGTWMTGEDGWKAFTPLRYWVDDMAMAARAVVIVQAPDFTMLTVTT